MGEVSWGAIASLICFGAEVAVWVIREGGPGVEAYLKKIVHYVVEFFVKEEIAEWIASHGGWVRAIVLGFITSPAMVSPSFFSSQVGLLPM